MRDSNRAAFRNLLLKEGYDGTRRPKYIAEANNREACAGRARSEALNAELRQSLGCAHDVGRAYGLVR